MFFLIDVCLVATAPTVYGIETVRRWKEVQLLVNYKLQQHLPFTVLKHRYRLEYRQIFVSVATAPTVYGIETVLNIGQRLVCIVATAPTVYGIET